MNNDSFKGMSVKDLVDFKDNTCKDIEVSKAHTVFLEKRVSDLITAIGRECSLKGHSFTPTKTKSVKVGVKHIDGYYEHPPFECNDSGEPVSSTWVKGYDVDVFKDRDIRVCLICGYIEQRTLAKNVGEWSELNKESE